MSRFLGKDEAVLNYERPDFMIEAIFPDSGRFGSLEICNRLSPTRLARSTLLPCFFLCSVIKNQKGGKGNPNCYGATGEPRCLLLWCQVHGL